MTDQLSDDYLLEDEDDDETALPPRPRRRLITPVRVPFAAVLVAALGFIGGVEVQKGQANSGAGTASVAVASSGGGRGGFTRPGGGGRAAPQGNATVGSVANKHGGTLYVKDADGNTVRVKTTSHSKINRTASSSAAAIHPGDTVIVQGTKSSNGTVTATQINATSATAAAGGGLGGLFGAGGFGGRSGAGGPGGGQAQSGGAQQSATPDGG
jgi:hypothetical protein